MRFSPRGSGLEQLVSWHAPASQGQALLPNKRLQPTSLPPDLHVDPMLSAGGRAAAEPRRWAALRRCAE